MNDKNTELFFGDDEDVIITLTDEDGEDTDGQLMFAFEIEELQTEYVAVSLLDKNQEPTGELLALRYEEDEEGEAVVAPIEDEQEQEIVLQALQSLIDSGELGDEEEDEEEEGDYLDDIGDIFPGISIDKE